MTRLFDSQYRIITVLNGRATFVIATPPLMIILLLMVLLFTILVFSLMSGSYSLTVQEVLQALINPSETPSAETVVWSFRFPRTLVAMIVGCLLALSGATLQSVTRNSLADPSLVGVSQGASLAVVILIIMMPDVSSYYRPIAAFGGALLIAALIQWMSIQRREADTNTMRFILTGIGVAAFISAATSVILTYGNINRAMSALVWLSGSIHSVGWGEVQYLVTATILLLPVLFWASRPIAALKLGTDLAISLGVKVEEAKVILITLSVALAALATAAVGPLGFVGLVAPHVARRISHTGVGLHLLLSGLIGAVLVSTADLVGRTAFESIQVPAGLVTAIIGVPVFVLVIVRSQSRDAI